MNTPNKASPTPSGVFVSTLSAMHGGNVLTDLDDTLREVTKAVNDAQKKGKLILTLTVIPNGLGVGEVPLFKVEENVKATLPKKPRQGQSFFADEDSNLTRRNPNQKDMNLTLVSDNPDTGKLPAMKSASN